MSHSVSDKRLMKVPYFLWVYVIVSAGNESVFTRAKLASTSARGQTEALTLISAPRLGGVTLPYAHRISHLSMSNRNILHTATH